MGNEDSTTSGKTIKERTVKKKAARSIVAPKTDEEITGRESRRRESFAAMNRQPVSERESRVIKTPGGMKVREESGKGVKMVTAPIRLLPTGSSFTSENPGLYPLWKICYPKPI